jgi:hypothetical protein
MPLLLLAGLVVIAWLSKRRPRNTQARSCGQLALLATGSALIVSGMLAFIFHGWVETPPYAGSGPDCQVAPFDAVILGRDEHPYPQAYSPEDAADLASFCKKSERDIFWRGVQIASPMLLLGLVALVAARPRRIATTAS